MTRGTPFPIGKLPAKVLQTLLQTCPVPKSSGVVVGPRFGEDAAVIDIGAKYLVAKTDPITFTAERIGWYAVNINANDIATLGACPRWFLATLLLPEKRSTAALARSIFRDILGACRALGITLCGGHTEITAGLERPIVVGQMLGEVEKAKLVRKESQQPGDVVILTGGIALEGTALLAREKVAELVRRLGRTVVRRAQRLLFRPGISVVQAARLAVRHGVVHAMHDPTEGGLLSGLYEIARAGRVGLRVWKEKVPLLPETQAFARVLNFDPFALIASGALLVVAHRDSAAKLLRAFTRRKIVAAAIGEVQPQQAGIQMFERGRAVPWRVPARDEIARLLA
ncbi:MAG: AIR synthase family protein [Acidobacteriia bacterium]|nr:AIR synthase family protein [Terriglobia bacterium]